jgi:hypothetical protein
MARTLLSLAVLLPLVIGTSGAPEAAGPFRLEDCPFPVDPNLVVGKLLGWVQIELGEQLAHTRTWSDPDGDSARIEIVSAPAGVKLINKPKINAYTLLWRPTSVTTAAIVVRITDKPVTGQAKSDTGTLLVQVVPARKKTTRGLCGGPSQ